MAFLQAQGNIEPAELARTFNCGIGMAVIVSPESAEGIVRALEGATDKDVFEIGSIEEGPRGCTVSGKVGTWNSARDWSATHNA